MSNKNDKIVLDYHDSLLHESDLKLLNSPNWLNDRIIAFVFEYFEYETYANEVKTNKIAFLNPSVIQFIKLDTDLNEIITCFLEPLNLQDKQIILLPINDNKDTTQSGGSHWSLLVINKPKSTFIHYDSFSGSNRRTALEIYEKFKVYFKCNKYEDSLKCPQQTNTCDCGVYVIAISDYIAKRIKEYDDFSSFDNDDHMVEVIKPDYVKNLRDFYKELILKLNN